MPLPLYSLVEVAKGWRVVVPAPRRKHPWGAQAGTQKHQGLDPRLRGDDDLISVTLNRAGLNQR